MSKDRTVTQVARSRYWREEDARLVVDAWREGKESLAAFARRYGLKEDRVARWVRRLSPAESLQFHPVAVVSNSPGPCGRGIAVELTDGTTVRLVDDFVADDFRRVLRVLDEREC